MRFILVRNYFWALSHFLPRQFVLWIFYSCRHLSINFFLWFIGPLYHPFGVYCILVARLRDILTGKALTNFQDSSDDDKASFTTMWDNLLASQNPTAESYSQRFLRVAPSADHSFTDYVSCIKTLLTDASVCHISPLTNSCMTSVSR